MKPFFEKVVKYRKIIFAVFMVLAAITACCYPKVGVNYDMNAYLPEDTPSTVAINVMEEEFEGEIPNVRVMIKADSKKEALAYKSQLKEVDGVIDVMWLDDATYMNYLDMPVDFYDTETVETYYKDGYAVYTVTVSADKRIEAVNGIRELIGDENAMTGTAVSTAIATEGTVVEVMRIAEIAVVIVFLVLLFATDAWIEPVVIMIGLGTAIVINAGSNLIFGEISFVTNAAGNILQLAVSLDYSIFLIHRYEDIKLRTNNNEEAMVEALCKSFSTILSSGLTTVIGFLALVLMQFQIGPDLGLALAKGVCISLVSVFTFMPSVVLMFDKQLEKTKHKSLMPSFEPFGRVIRKITVPLALAFVLIAAPAYYCSTHNDYYYGGGFIYGEGTQYYEDTQKIDNIFGKSDTYVIMVPDEDEAKERKLLSEIADMDTVTSITSMSSIFGPMISDEIVPDSLSSQLNSENYHRSVLSVKVDQEGTETEKTVEKIRKLAQEYYPGEYKLAGSGVSTYDLKTTVESDMIKVNLVAIGAILLILIFTMKNLFVSVVLVLTIETCIWLNLSMYFVFDNPVFYIAYLIISSVQLGATVDYAILLTSRYRENRPLYEKGECLVETIKQVAPSLLTSGSILAIVGFLMGIICTHGVIAQLGMLVGRGAVFSLAGVLFVLPGLLYITDRFFYKKEM